MRLHLAPGVQHEVPVQLPKVVEGILALCAVVGALLILLFVLLLLLSPGGSALPSPRGLFFFLPQHPAFGGGCFLGGCGGRAETAGWGAWWGLPKG